MLKNVYNAFKNSLNIRRSSNKLVLTFSSDICVYSRQFGGVRYVSNAFPIIFRMRNQALVKHVPGDARFTFSFLYNHLKSGAVSAGQDGKPGRQFNMNRGLDEPFDQFTARVQANVEKIVNKKKKKNVEETKIDVKFIQQSGEELTDISTAGDLLKKSGLKMIINGTEYDLIVNPPLVEEAKIAEPLMAGFFTNPTKIELAFNDSAKYEWFTSKDKLSSSVDPKKPKLQDLRPEFWNLKKEGFFFTPDKLDIGCTVRLDITPFSGEIKGDTFTVISNSQIEAPPDMSATRARQAWTPAVTEFPRLRVMTYNILADLYADSEFAMTELFPQCPRFAMDYRYRVRLILEEIINFHPDILCLQETDRKVFKHDLFPVLDKYGLSGEFAKKGGQVDEGLSIFFRKSKFNLLQSKSMVFSEELNNRYGHLMKVVSKVPGLKDRLLQRTTAVHMLAIESIDNSGNILIVGNTHLFFKPDADHIRLLQIDMCLTEIKLFRDEIEKENPGKQVSVLLCGDFNSTPPFGVLQYCREGHISETHRDWSSCPGEEVTGLQLKHSFRLDSAAGTPQYTNYTVGFKDCLDYIFYDKTAFTVDQVIPFPTNEELALNTALPNVSFPSDHISVVADLKWNDAKM